ncbi:AVT5 [Hepatospora eriocheir]|uniref:AVT5 n=1 Tax=Hepatospora eriocheir TaxID=1081669 RepID=A0A1X0Q9U3_9MICR|nr:AVT5 [Hepatospora eriocheir]
MKSLLSAYVNLLKTSIGSGVLNFPKLCKTYGLGLTVLLTIISGLFATTGLVLLIICSEEIGRTADLSKLASLSIPFVRIFVDLAVFMKCFGVSLSYLIIAGDLMVSVVVKFSTIPLFSYKPFLLGIFICIVGPFCYYRKMDKLKYTSFVGVLAIIFVVIASIWRFLKTQVLDSHKVEYLVTPISRSWLGGLGKFVFSFTCHQNIFFIYSELEDNSLKRMKKLIYITASTSFILYTLFGSYNYLLYGNETNDNVLLNYPSDNLTLLVKILYIIVMAVSFPLQMSPGKLYLLNCLNIKPTIRGYNTLLFIVTTILLLLAYLFTISDIKLGLVYAIIGATASTFMSLILPPLYYLNLEVERTLFLTIISYFAFLFGIFVFLTTMISIVLDISVKK